MLFEHTNGPLNPPFIKDGRRPKRHSDVEFAVAGLINQAVDTKSKIATHLLIISIPDRCELWLPEPCSDNPDRHRHYNE